MILMEALVSSSYTPVNKHTILETTSKLKDRVQTVRIRPQSATQSSRLPIILWSQLELFQFLNNRPPFPILIMPQVAATGMNLETVILRQTSYDTAYMWNLKKMVQTNLFTNQKQSQM